MWIYKNKKDNSARYILGEHGKKPLVCFGINPSTAEPDNLDNTLRSVRNNSIRKNYDGWIMFNLYPQRATLPNNLHPKLDQEIHQENLLHIKDIFSTYGDLTVWAAWGGLIEKRPFLKECFMDIIKIVRPYKARWVCRGKLVNNKHPHHPLYLGNHLPFRRFDVEGYVKVLGSER